ncbi:hypothetical protein Tco_1169620 [Tanacetum coccineum]
MTYKAQQSAIDNALVAQENQRVIGKCNIRINPGMKPKEPTYQVVLDALALTTCYPAFLITAEVPVKNLMNHQLKRKLYLLSRELVILEKKINKKDFHISQASGSCDGTDFESGVPDEQQRKLFNTDERIGVKPGVPDVPKYDSESNKESCGDSVEEDDDDEDDTEDDEGNDDGDDSDGNDDDDNNDGDDDDDSDQERTKSDRDEIPNLNQFNEEHEEEEEENVDEFTNKEDDEENEEESDDGEELYKDVNVNLRQEDVGMTNADQGGADQHNTEVPMQSSPVSSDFTEKVLNFENVSPADNEIDSLMYTTVRTEEPSSQTSTLRFNDRVTNLERDLSEMKQVDQYAQSISSIPAIVDRYMDNKLGEVIHKAIKSHNAECRKEAQAEKHEYIDLVDSFSNPVIERNVIESLEAAILARSSSQPKSTYEAAASLSEADYKKELYDALLKSYNTDKDLFNTYGEVFTLKRSRDDKDKDQDPSAGSDRGTKRRKSSKEAETQKDPRSKEGMSSSSSKDTSRSHHKSSGKSAHAEEPSHTVDDSGVQKNQEFDTGNNDEQPKDEAAPKNECVTARAEKPSTSFDELTDTPIDFSAFVMNQLNITNLTQELLVGPTFNLLKGTYKSLTELEYHFEECSKATTERLDWHNPEGKPYPFDLRKPLLLIQDY